MALQKFGIEVAGERQYARAFEAMASEVDDLSEPLSEVGDLIRHHVAEQFLTEGAAGSLGKWKPLNPDYDRWKRSQVGEMPILVYTGAMFTKATAESAVHVTPQRMLYEIDDPKAYWHQTGAGNLPDDPPRKIVDMNLETRREIDRIFANYLNRIRRGPFASAR